MNKKRKPEKNLLELMIITSEECGELIQVCSKILRKYDESDDINDNYSSLLLEEAGDVLCMLELLVEHGLVDKKELDKRVKTKREKLKVWSDLIK